MSKTLFFYVFKDLVRIFLMASGALAGIMSFGGLLRPLTTKGLDGSQVFLLIKYLMPSMSTYSLPVAALFATTVVYGRMSADNEITACRASGISFLAMTAPAFVLGIGVAILSLFLLCFTVPAATMRVEQVISSNLGKLIAHEIEQSHETHFDTWTVFAENAYLGPDDPAHPHDQTVLLTGPLVVSYEHPPERTAQKWYRRAKDFWSAKTATIHIHERDDASAQVRIELDDGVVFPRQFTEKKSQQGGVGTGEFGPMEIPSLLGEKTKFLDIFALKRLQFDPSGGAQVQKVTAQFIEEDESAAMAARTADELRNPTGAVFVSGPDTFTLTAPGAKVATTGGAVTVTAGASPIVFHRDTGGGLDWVGKSACHLQFMASPDAKPPTASVKVTMADATVDADGESTAAPLDKTFSVLLPDTIAAMNGRTADMYLKDNGKFRDAKARSKLLFEWVDLYDHVLSEINARLAFVISCLLLVMVGASLGMMFKSGNFLSAFSVSVVPAMFCTVLIVTGQHTAESTPLDATMTHNPLNFGIALIWSSDVMIAVAASILLWRLQRR